MNCPIILQLDNITKQFTSSATTAVAQVSFTLHKGELLGLLGPSGCGKTTLLRMIAGFEQPTDGLIYLDGSTMSSAKHCVPPEQRNTGMVFQDYALFPHLTVVENIAFGLNRTGLRRSQIRARVAEVLLLVELSGLESRYPHELSGGQQQRVSLARALAPRPALILLDEPLSNLDVQVRQHIRHDVRNILKAADMTAIFVTHDQEEALAICDRVAVMRQGQIEQLAAPEEIYAAPSSRFVAEFVTQANFLPVKRRGNVWETDIDHWSIPAIPAATEAQTGELMLRQEDIALQPDESSPVVIRERHFLGREYRYCLDTPSGSRLHARSAIADPLPVGTRVKLSVTNRAPQIFPRPTTNQAIPASSFVLSA